MLLRTSKDCARIENTYTNKVQVDSTSNTLMHEYSWRKKLYNPIVRYCRINIVQRASFGHQINSHDESLGRDQYIRPPPSTDCCMNRKTIDIRQSWDQESIMEIKADLAKNALACCCFATLYEWLSTGNIFRGRRSWSKGGRWGQSSSVAMY
jgi:hypothetical protein